ncbi:helix-turn-helix transcriptional regulator [Streptomyces sp. NPDC057654]|uniref:helix-turn-helix transcriptional regulator n=1 Tax=Streptomyces sp. NPDC057654 TaxID=3346196 RepID=UPI0036A47ED9
MTTMAQESGRLAQAPARSTATGPEVRRDTGAEVRRSELAAFLRSRRERITPEQAGLARGRRRRTPGLRREEVAHLAAVGVTWYTWLEQARDIRVSAQVLDSLARALMLDHSERFHLFALAGTADPHPNSECTGVSESLRAMLRQLEPFPACVQNSRYDILAHNRTYGQLMCDLDALPQEDRNCMLLAFTNAAWSQSLVNRDEVVRSMAAKFRASMAEHLAEPAWKAMLKRLQDESPEFRELWARHEVVRATTRTWIFRQSRVGLLRMQYTALWTGPSSGPRLLTYTPVDEETRERLHRLHELVLAGPSSRSAGEAGEV